MDNELVLISPEGMEIAQAYLINRSNIEATAQELGLPIEIVQEQLQKREVQAYIDRVFNESGFRNRDRMAAVWDSVLEQKLEELEDTGLGSNKDIVEILEKMHKFKKEEFEMQMKLLEAQKKDAPTIQVNQQNNIGGTNYNALLEKLLTTPIDGIDNDNGGQY